MWKAVSQIALFAVVFTTTTVMRKAPLLESPALKILTCGELLDPTQGLEKQSDYGKWVHVKLRNPSNTQGWIPKKAFLESDYVHCPLLGLSPKAINNGVADQEAAARLDEAIEGIPKP
jgi:hypothetical protein